MALKVQQILVPITNGRLIQHHCHFYPSRRPASMDRHRRRACADVDLPWQLRKTHVPDTTKILDGMLELHSWTLLDHKMRNVQKLIWLSVKEE